MLTKCQSLFSARGTQPPEISQRRKKDQQTTLSTRTAESQQKCSTGSYSEWRTQGKSSRPTSTDPTKVEPPQTIQLYLDGVETRNFPPQRNSHIWRECWRMKIKSNQGFELLDFRWNLAQSCWIIFSSKAFEVVWQSARIRSPLEIIWQSLLNEIWL